MAAPGCDMDPVDREFDRLLEETGRAVSRSATAAPVSDAAFESLLTAFKSLNGPHSTCETGGGSERRQAAPATPRITAVEEVVRAWGSLAPCMSQAADPALRQAMRRMECAVINLQLAQDTASSSAVLAARVACQPFALALDQVIEVLEPQQARVERDGARVWAVNGPERVPLHFVRHWLAQDHAEMTIAEDAWIVMAALGARRVGFVVDGVEGVVPASRQPPGVLLRGMHGIVAVAVAGKRLLPLLDFATLLKDDAREGGGRATQGAVADGRRGG